MALFPSSQHSALRSLAWRFLLALSIIIFVACVVFIDRDGYRDLDDSSITILDALYYSSVSVTTTGYGDITPVSEKARLLTTLLVTPARIIFLILLVGTTVELLFGRLREGVRQERWERGISEHYLVLGYGVKGRVAADQLVQHGTNKKEIVVIDSSDSACQRAREDGFVSFYGDASDERLLAKAQISKAGVVLVALSRDDAAVLATLRIKKLAPGVRIIATCREDVSSEPLRQAGADTVIVSAGAAGRLLGLAGETPYAADVLQDIFDPTDGLDIVEHEVTEKDNPPADCVILGVVRQGKMTRWPDSEQMDIRAGDRLVLVRSS